MNTRKDVGHTPGPWKISKAFGNFTICESTEVNLVNSGKWNPEVCTGIVSFADAHLIAAAPDLSEAAKNTDEKSTLLFALLAKRGVVFTPEEEKLAQDFYIKNQRAIAKAEGK